MTRRMEIVTGSSLNWDLIPLLAKKKKKLNKIIVCLTRISKAPRVSPNSSSFSASTSTKNPFPPAPMEITSKKMRSRVSNMDAAPESEPEMLSLSPSPPPRVAFNLSSMVVKPPASSGGGSDLDVGYPSDDRVSSPPQRRLDSLRDLQSRDSVGDRRGGSSPSHRRRSPEGFGRRVFQPSLHRRRSLIGLRRNRSPLDFHLRSPRLRNDAGFMQRPGSISPPRRLRADGGYYEPDFDHPRAPHSGRGMRGRGGGRFRDISPPAFGRGGGLHPRGFNSSAHGASLLKGEFVHRNDPNLSPREGDWICQNPSCGNLNFARRSNCNNCHKYRYDEPYGSNRSPHKGYVSPSLHRSYSPKLSVSPIYRAPQRDFNGYRSPPPPRDWDPDEFSTNLIPPRRGGKFFQPIRRGNFREKRGRPDWSPGGAWERRSRGAFIDEERRVNRNPLSPHDRLIRDTRDRSRSPVGGRLPKGSFAGRSRDDRRYDGPYARRGRSDDFNAAHVGGYKHGGARGRSPNVF